MGHWQQAGGMLEQACAAMYSSGVWNPGTRAEESMAELTQPLLQGLLHRLIDHPRQGGACRGRIHVQVQVRCRSCRQLEKCWKNAVLWKLLARAVMCCAGVGTADMMNEDQQPQTAMQRVYQVPASKCVQGLPS